jgi:hypothetical protein
LNPRLFRLPHFSQIYSLFLAHCSGLLIICISKARRYFLRSNQIPARIIAKTIWGEAKVPLSEPMYALVVLRSAFCFPLDHI